MAKLKNRNSDKHRQLLWFKGDPSIQIPEGQKYQLTWFYWLTAHAFIQGGLIYFFFPIIQIAILEIISHWLTDYMKCTNKTNIHIDQGIHLSLRILYTFLIIYK